MIRKSVPLSILVPVLCLSAATIIAPLFTLFSAVAITPIFLIAGAVWVAFLENRRQALCENGRAPIIWMAAAAGWALLTCLWTAVPLGQALRTILGLIGLALLGLTMVGSARRLDKQKRNVPGAALVIGMAVAALVLLMEVNINYPLTKALQTLKHGTPPTEGMDSMVSRGVAVLAVMMWPALAAALKWGLTATLPLVFTIGAAIVGNGKYASVLALAVGCTVFAFTWIWPRVALNALRLSAILLVLAIPLVGHLLPKIDEVGHSGLFNSARHRIVIWHFALDRLAEHPLRGWGMEASRALPGGEESVEILVVEANATPTTFLYPQLPLHPHNGPLQVWLELGLPGALLMAIFLWWLTGRLMVQTSLRAHTALAAAAVASAGIIGALSFGIWQSWWQSTLWLTAICFALTSPKPVGDLPELL